MLITQNYIHQESDRTVINIYALIKTEIKRTLVLLLNFNAFICFYNNYNLWRFKKKYISSRVAYFTFTKTLTLSQNSAIYN